MSKPSSNKRIVSVFPAEHSGNFIFEFKDYGRQLMPRQVAVVEGTWDEMGEVVSVFIETGVFDCRGLVL